jgi:hypothetical protein
MPNSIEWGVLSGLKTRLETITTANGYETDVQVVDLIDRFADVSIEYPAVMFSPLRVRRPDDERLRRIDARMTVDLVLLLETFEDATRKIGNFVADVEKALTTDLSGNLDSTLGGLTKDIHVLSDSRYQIDSEGGPRAAALVQIEVVFRYGAGNPYSST